MIRECFARRFTRELLAKHSCLYLSWLFIFQSYAGHMHHFAGCLVASYPQKLFCLQLFESSHTLSITQPLQLNPTINTWYKRLNKITIKFGIELKPTKHIVVNYNFTLMIIFFLIFNKIEWVVIFILFIFLETCGEFYWVYVIVSFSFFNFIVCYY